MSNPVAGAGRIGTVTVVAIVAPAEFTPVTVKGKEVFVSVAATDTTHEVPSPDGTSVTDVSADDHTGTEPACKAPFGLSVKVPLPPSTTPEIGISFAPF